MDRDWILEYAEEPHRMDAAPASSSHFALRGREAAGRVDVRSRWWSDALQKDGHVSPSLRDAEQSVPDLPTGVSEGEVLAGRYRIGEVLGAGAMGTVVAAHHLLLDQKVAIKFLIPEALGHADAVTRFVREGRATVRLKGEHVVRVFDVALLDSGVPYIVMEYLEGCDLAVWLEQRRPLAVEEAVDFVLQACDGIAEAHALGIIHRDLKPANLFAVQSAGIVQSIKVLDFGVSKTEEPVPRTQPSTAAAAPITERQTTVGSPVYMSPEQMESARDVDVRTDIWSLGVTLCELLTGRVPFDGHTLVHVYARIAANAPIRLRDVHPHLPAGLEAVVLKCLQRNRERRYASVTDLAMALMTFGSPDAAHHVERLIRAQRSRTPAWSAEGEAAVSPSPRALESPVAHRTLVSRDGLSDPAPRRPLVEIVIGGVRKRLHIVIAFGLLAGVVVFFSARPLSKGSPPGVSRVADPPTAAAPRSAPPAPPQPTAGPLGGAASAPALAEGPATAVAGGLSQVSPPEAAAAASRMASAPRPPTELRPVARPAPSRLPVSRAPEPGSAGVAPVEDARVEVVRTEDAQSPAPPAPSATEYTPPRVRR